MATLKGQVFKGSGKTRDNLEERYQLLLWDPVRLGLSVMGVEMSTFQMGGRKGQKEDSRVRGVSTFQFNHSNLG